MGEILMKENTVESVLKLNHLVFDEVSFVREGFKTENKFQMEFGAEVETGEAQGYIVRLRIIGVVEDEYKVIIRVSGYFEIDKDMNEKDVILKQNAVAILFPYVRSELTLLTAQPEVTPIIIPPLNIVQMMQNNNS